MRIGDAIRARRSAAGITSREAAHRAGISVPAWSDIERGAVKHPRARTLESIAGALGVTVDDLRRDTETQEPDAQSTVVLRLWSILAPQDRDDILAEIARRAIPGRSFDDADDALALAAR